MLYISFLIVLYLLTHLNIIIQFLALQLENDFGRFFSILIFNKKRKDDWTGWKWLSSAIKLLIGPGKVDINLRGLQNTYTRTHKQTHSHAHIEC